jgi:hypothetical protein
MIFSFPGSNENCMYAVPLRPIVSTNGAPTYRLAQHLAGLLGAHIGGSPHHVRNSVESIDTIHILRAGPRDILVSFDVVSLFTMVPIEEALRLFRHVLTSSFFRLNCQFYEQTDGVAMGSPLSPVIANYFMEYFEEIALQTATHKNPSAGFVT